MKLYELNYGDKFKFDHEDTVWIRGKGDGACIWIRNDKDPEQQGPVYAWNEVTPI